jgi:predicted nucleic-acid-binding protein
MGGFFVRVGIDTNILVRYTVEDDINQTEIAQNIIESADEIIIPAMVLCEYVWVLRSRYKLTTAEIRQAITVILETKNVVLDRLTVTHGLAALDQGGDFADAVIAYTSRWMGAEQFVTFDRKASRVLADIGLSVTLLG